MTNEQSALGIFFPPRIVWMKPQIQDSHEKLDDAAKRYMDEGVVILANDDYIRDAFKIIQYAALFPQVCDPEWKEPEEKKVDTIFSVPVVADPTMAEGEMKIVNKNTGESVHVKGIGVMGERELDMVNHPPHYTAGGIETIEYLRAKLTPEEFRGFCRGNALKYLSRAGMKGEGNEDYKKAKWYLDALLK